MRLTYSILLELHVRLTRSLNARLLLRIIKFCANIYIELYFNHFREGSQELKPSGELGLEKFHNPGLHPERPGEHRRWDGRVGAEKRERHKDDAGVLAVEGDDHGSLGLTDVELEVHEAARDEERLPSAHHPGVELVPRVKAAKDSNEELTFHHDADLGGTGVDVRRVGAPRREVHTVHRHAQRVGTGPLSHVKLRQAEPFGVDVLPALASLDEKRKSSPASDMGLHGCPFTETALPPRSATQKSWRGSESVARAGPRSNMANRPAMVFAYSIAC
uniref:Uncharacterized protein n=1 Tax=Triticum urartu TaxID=4572 RepID=A0A8R7U7H7_TRIUA